uniref:Protein ALWAYS EARLY 3 n=1 Tax=Noccaea caerulescens TaxID=107243 RepID=A0A1J3IPK2_NOCCA
MAPSRSKKSKYKKTPRGKAVSPNKEEESMSKTKQRKRRLSDMLGPQWSKEELERFYEGYRKFGKEWKKVAAFVHSRSADMVEALYTMNKAYLSLPEGTASVVGLNAMMTDHYSVLHGRSDSEQENNEGFETPRSAPKRSRVKSSDHPSTGLEGLSDRLQFRSSSGGLPSLKKRRTETTPRAVGKRTPRIPISYNLEKDTSKRYVSPGKRGLNMNGDDTDDDMEHEIALALTEASQRVGSTKKSNTATRQAKMYSPDKKGERMRADIDLAIAKLRATDMEDVRREPSLGSTEADNVDYSGGRNDLTHGEGSSAMDLQQNGKKYYRRRFGIKADDAKEACSGTDEAQSLDALDEKFEPEGDGKSSKLTYRGSRRKSKKSLFTADEDTACDALQTLADLSLMMPETATDTESSIQAEEKRAGNAYVSDLKGADPASMSKGGSVRNSKQRRSVSNDPCNSEAERKSPSSSVIRTRRQKASPSKLPKDELAASSLVIEPPNNKGIAEGNKPVGRGKRSASIRNSHEKKSVKSQDRTSSTNNIVEEDESAPSAAVAKKQVNLPTKVRSRRKLVTEKPLTIDDWKNSETLEKFSHCISSFRARRWCLFEWFYSAIDYPWFARQEFVEYLDHVGLGHVPRLTRVEWGVIRSSLGKPRRFSEQFLKEEKEKLYLYRDSVRKHYDELNTGMREGLPMDLARPLNVSQRVISLHPKSREIHDGSVLTVDQCRYRIQFDNPELGVEFVKDTECMPLNPLENMPASLARHYALSLHTQNSSEEKMHEPVKGSMPEGYLKISCETGHPTSSVNYSISNSVKQEKVDISSSNQQAQDGDDEALDLQLLNSQPSNIGHIHAREADVQALSELTRALNKKELVLRELKCMNDEVVESQKDGDNALKDSESFKKQYAAVLFQLSEINEQVSLALLGLRQRNTYQENVPCTSVRRTSESGEPDGQLTYLDNDASDTNGFHVSEIVDSSRIKARKMVHRAIQALTILRKDKNNAVNIEEAIDFVNNQLSVDQTEESSVQQTQASQDQRLPFTPNPPSSAHAEDSHLNPLDQNDLQIPSELVSRCMATLLMIQKCTERQFPPSEVAQVLDSAVASLQPCSSRNLPIYTEIQKCMGIIRNQILALVPS